MVTINLLNSFITKHAREAERRHGFKWALIGSFIFTLLIALCILQTEWFVRLFPRPGGVRRIRLDMARDRQAQRRRRAEYLAARAAVPVRGIEVDSLFTEEEQGQIRRALEFLLRDERLREELRRSFGVSFEDLDVVLIPAAFMNSVNCERLGVTRAGWKDADDHSAWGFSVSGVTVRDRAGTSRKATFDGRPRIALHPWSFRSRKALRRALFHEMLHALNVPGYKASALTRAQSDLAYLPEYRAFVKRARLNDEFDEYGVAVVLAILTLMLGRCVLLAYRASPRRGPRPR